MSQLGDVVDRYLEDLDPILADEGMALQHRALQSALAFVEDMVQHVQGGTLENPIGQPWFDAIHFETLRWYRARYGDAMRVDSDGDASGIVVVRGVPVALTFPLTVSRPGSEQMTTRLSYPDAVRADEDPLAFMSGHLDVAAFPEPTRAQIQRDIAHVVGRTRQLNRHLRFADLSPTAKAFANRVMWSLRSGVESIAAGIGDRLGVCVWDLNLVAELTAKVMLLQKGVSPPRTHDVRELHRLTLVSGLTEPAAGILDPFPTGAAAVAHRYGEKALPSLPDVLRLYGSTLDLALHYATHCNRGIWIAPDGWIEVRTIRSFARGA